MNTEQIHRVLAFTLGALLLFHGMDKVVNGMNRIETIVIDYNLVVPYEHYSSFFFHSMGKAMSGMMYMGQMMETEHLSSSTRKYLIYGVYMAELISPILLILGRYIRIAAGIIAVDMLVAIVLVHKDMIFTLGEGGGWSIELPVLYLLIALLLAFWKFTPEIKIPLKKPPQKRKPSRKKKS